MTNLQQHWYTVFETKNEQEVSWYQINPKTSIAFFEALDLPKTANIIDVGAGDSYFVDYLVNNGYENIYVLDIAEKALEKVKTRLRDKAANINWIVSNVLDFETNVSFDFWHDRASFHFQTDEHKISKYVSIVEKNISPNGWMLIATFSLKGAKKCSGLEIKQYSKITLTNQFRNSFKKIKCMYENHETPFHTIQHFVFCSFLKIKR